MICYRFSNFHNPIHHLLNAKSIFTHQSIKATISPKRRDMPSACFQCADTLPIASKYTTKKYRRRIFKSVGNGVYTAITKQGHLHGVSHHSASPMPTPPLISVSPCFFPLNHINTANQSSKEAIYFLWDIQYHQPTRKNWALQKSA